jgi:nucleoid DNA-binding protein
MTSVFDKNDLVDELLKLHSQYPKAVVNKVVETFFNELAVVITCGDKVELRGFGAISIKFSKRSEMNKIKLRALWKPSKILLEMINQ